MHVVITGDYEVADNSDERQEDYSTSDVELIEEYDAITISNLLRPFFMENLNIQIEPKE